MEEINLIKNQEKLCGGIEAIVKAGCHSHLLRDETFYQSFERYLPLSELVKRYSRELTSFSGGGTFSNSDLAAE